MATKPMAEVTQINRNQAEQISSSWWIVLLTGIISVVAGFVILSISWTLTTLGIFVGAFLLIRGILQALAPASPRVSRSWNITIGVIEAIVGAGILIFPLFAAYTLLMLAFIAGIWIVAWGGYTIVSSIANRRVQSYWWLSLIAGILAVPLGLFALYRPILTLAVAIVVLGIWAIVVGVAEIALSFEIRSLPRTLAEMEAVPGRAMPAATPAEIEHMAKLRDQGIITEEEFQKYKARRLAA